MCLGLEGGKISVNRSWKIPQSDHFCINQENGFCQDFVDCNGFFGLRVRLQVNKSVTILIQSRQSCRNSVQSSIVKCQYNPTQSIPIPAQFIGLYEDWPIVFGLYNCGIWHRGCGITYTPPYAKKLCQKELCWLLLYYADCNWIVQLYVDCKIVIGLYDCNWIVPLYFDCTIVFGLYYCTWII